MLAYFANKREYMFFLKGGCREGQSVEMKEKKRKMKRTLWSWGQAMERFGWKAEELEKMEGFYKLQRKIWEGNSNPLAQRALEKAEREFSELLIHHLICSISQEQM